MSITLKANVVVQNGRRLVIHGSDSIITPGPFQFLVRKGGKLRITNATLSGSSNTSAIQTEGTTELQQTIMQNNSAGTGAAVVVMPGGRLDAISAVFRNNRADQLGGALQCVKDASLTFEDTEMSGNIVEGSGVPNGYELGGAFYAGKGCTVAFCRTTLSNNFARYAGGALTVGGANVTFSGLLHAAGNAAGRYGGFLSFFQGGIAKVQNAFFSNTSAAREGGLVYIINGGSFVCTDCAITGSIGRPCSGLANFWKDASCHSLVEADPKRCDHYNYKMNCQLKCCQVQWAGEDLFGKG